MNNSIIKRALPYLVAVLAMLLLNALYFKPVMFDNKVLKQHDMTQWKGSANEAIEYNKSGKIAFWTNAMFSGMPTYQIAIPYKSNLIDDLLRPLMLFMHSPLSTFFMLMLGFFLMLLSFGVNPWLGIAGSFAFALSSNNLIFLSAGHETKVLAISLTPLVIGAINFTLRRNRFIGAALTSVAVSFQFAANHLQITYYMLFIVGLWMLAELVYAFMQKQIKTAIISMAFVAVASAIGVGTTISNILVTTEYGNETIRGKSDLASKTNEDGELSGGLDKDYALDYSYVGLEPLTILIPNLYGGAEMAEFNKNTQTYKYLQGQGQDNAKQLTEYLTGYWGQLRITAGPPYFGAIIVFLFVLALFVVKGPVKWGLVAATILSVLLSYGKNFLLLTDFFFYYFPLYNKFRAVTMILVMAQLCIPLLAFLGLKEIFDGKIKPADLKKFLLRSTAITAGLCLIFILIPGATVSFDADKYVSMKLPDSLVELLQSDCEAVVRMDALRSFFFVLVGAGLIWAFMANKLKKEWIYGLLALAVVIDLFPVDRRYLNADNFERKKKEAEFAMSNADQQIRRDTDPNYRVLNLTVSTFNDATTSYYHKSIGGYHGAKLRRYQELIENELGGEIQFLQSRLKEVSDDSSLQFMMMRMPAVNMLNTKYIIVNPDGAPLVNKNALGNCWFVDEALTVANADSEIAEIGKINPATTCVIDKQFAKQIPSGFSKDPSGSIKLTGYDPNQLEYQSQCSSPQVAVFSEVFYDKGWEAYIDGQKTDYFRCNYVLRGLTVPAGNHKIEFRFNPTTYKTGERIALASSILIYLLLIGSIVFTTIQNRKASKTE